MNPLRNVKMFYHKVHKEISQRVQSVEIQTGFFAPFVYALFSLWVKALFGVGSKLRIKSYIHNYTLNSKLRYIPLPPSKGESNL